MVAFIHRTGLKRIAAGLLAAAWLLAAPLAAQAQNTKAVDDLLNQAQKAMQKGQPRDAENLLRKAIDAAPARAELYMLRSRARDSSGKYELALEDANKYIELEPSDALGYLNRSRIYISMDRPETALADATKAIELDPKEPDGYYRRSDIYRDMGKEAEAKADEAKAAQLEKS
ncbi:tetratricopeptide repeat protein [Steroidobacter cummioxidans]|uniref:tetratricopeptide repeat protein n=1 Tax=Steroidobacter cummioxidans TaxID=1803913 RepID=UPI000E319DD3|nr:tetratricopeptide repeat protein [Steroidobacter cummioxidans]